MQHGLFMLRCLEIAQKAKGHTAPNPMVGAVLVHNNRIIGEGWHHNYGADHAEVNCLKNVASADKHLICESNMYVNLEPCAHYGITPPCSTKLVKEQIKKVFIANLDPFDKVSGKGVEILREGGIEVESGLLENEGYWLNRRFFCNHKLSRPYIILKWAKTIDGFIAPLDKSRFQITNEISQQLSHKWRTEESAIMVGTTTAKNDNPQLTARLWQGKQPLRVVIDQVLKLDNHGNLFDDAAATWVINEKREGLLGNIHYIQMAFDDSFLKNLLQKLFDAKILSIIIEGGPTLLGSFIAAGLWDEARVFTGSTQLGFGIAAPVLTGADFAFENNLGGDKLQLFINKNSSYKYPKGYKLEL